MSRSILLFLLIIGVINFSSSTLFSKSKNEDGTWNVTYNCSHEKEKELTVEIWNSSLPGDMRFLTIANCKNLNILIGQHHKKRNFSELVVKDVDFCKITREGNEKIESALPVRSFFTNVKSLTIDVPLYQDIKESDEYFIDGILYFSNITIENFISRAIQLEKSSLKKFFMNGVHVKNASENAISFHGNHGSVLEIRNSFFEMVPNNFITCNVTNVKIWKNKFGNLKQGSFHLNSENIEFTGNTVERVEGYAFKISSNPYELIKNNDFKGINVDETLSHVSLVDLLHNKEESEEEVPLKLDEYFVPTSGGVNTEKEGEKCYQPSKEKLLKQSKSSPEMIETSILSFLSENVTLFWFLCITFLILLFPIAYFIKTYLCSSVDKVFPMEVKHQPLINVDDN